jgi:dTDP-4-dehydrorhamnose reductase
MTNSINNDPSESPLGQGGIKGGKKVLITGASGFLGWNICNIAKKEYHVYGTVYSHPLDIDDVQVIKLDLTDYNGLKRVFTEIKPDAVIHTAALTSPNYCQEHPEESEVINVDSSMNIAGLCADRAIPFVFTSTDLVFDGENAPYKEDDPVSPVNIYGEQKAASEERVLNTYPLAAVCRMPLMFGPASPAYSTFFQEMIDAMKNGGELKLFEDEIRTPVSAETAVKGIFISLEKGKGIIHLGGVERLSRYDFGILLSEVIRNNKADIVKLRQEDIPMAAPRAKDVSLDSAKAFGLGYKPLPLREELERLNQ